MNARKRCARGDTEASAQAVQKTAEAHQEQYIDRVVDVPVEKEPGDAEDSGSYVALNGTVTRTVH